MKAAILEFLLGQLHDGGVCLSVVVDVDVTCFFNGSLIACGYIARARGHMHIYPGQSCPYPVKVLDFPEVCFFSRACCEVLRVDQPSLYTTSPLL